MLLLAIGLILAVGVFGQAPATSSGTPGCTVYDYCKTSAEATFVAPNGQCTTLQRTNATAYDQCLCYYRVELDKCTIQCPDNPQVVVEHVSNQATIANVCGKVQLNPLALPSAPWLPPIVASRPLASPTGAPAPKQSGASNDAAKWTVDLALLALLL